jgi:hypothetical protein
MQQPLSFMMMGDKKQLAFRDKANYNGKSNKQV